MSDPATLDPTDLVGRAMRHNGLERSSAGATGAATLGADAAESLINASLFHPSWRLPEAARFKAARALAAWPLSAYTDRQTQFDADLLAACASLLFDCQALEARVAKLEAVIATLSAPDRNDPKDR